mmetsp:Transcript_39464/g.85101  ORF Transcript_39464/g.85101 Transcript_39464/m.85101 type:complete len:250 (-) Transcript_39464:74-823(-)
MLRHVQRRRRQYTSHGVTREDGVTDSRVSLGGWGGTRRPEEKRRGQERFIRLFVVVRGEFDYALLFLQCRDHPIFVFARQHFLDARRRHHLHSRRLQSIHACVAIVIGRILQHLLAAMDEGDLRFAIAAAEAIDQVQRQFHAGVASAHHYHIDRLFPIGPILAVDRTGVFQVRIQQCQSAFQLQRLLHGVKWKCVLRCTRNGIQRYFRSRRDDQCIVLHGFDATGSVRRFRYHYFPIVDIDAFHLRLEK